MSGLTTRMLKLKCRSCGNIAYASRARIAVPGFRCGCSSYPELRSEWLEEECRREAQAEELTAHTVRDKMVQIRKPRECDGCGHYCPIGEELRYRAYSTGGEFFTSYHCQGCESRSERSSRRFAMARV